MTPGTNEDGSLWSVDQWKDHAREQMSKPHTFAGPTSEAIAQRFKEANQMILDAPDTFTPKQMKNLVRHAAAVAMSSK